MIETKPKLTKKQIKRTNGPNSAVRFSLSAGKKLSPIYVGALPQFSLTYPNGQVRVMQTKKGIPFINTTLRD